MFIRNFRAMSTEVLLAAEGERASVGRGFEEVRQMIAVFEKQFTRFSEDSEISRLNRSSGAWFQTTPEMTLLMALSKEYSEITNGIFDPTILSSLERVGYDRGIDQIRSAGGFSMGSWDVLARGPIGMREVLVDTDGDRVFLPKGARVDLGGIAKGWIVEQAAYKLAEYSKACLVDAGGDMYVIGLPDGEDHWRVELENAVNPENTLGEISLVGGAIATSSVMKRVWKQGEEDRHHLIDPRTGLPASTDLASMTVTAPYACMAEVFAKALLLANPFEARSMAALIPELRYVAVTQRGNIYGTLPISELKNEIELEQKTTTMVA